MCKHFWINVGDSNRGVKRQNFRPLAQVCGLRIARNFLVLFTRARFGIKT